MCGAGVLYARSRTYSANCLIGCGITSATLCVKGTMSPHDAAAQLSCTFCMLAEKREINTVHFQEIADDSRAFHNVSDHEGLINVITQSCPHLAVRISAIAFVIFIEHHVA